MSIICRYSLFRLKYSIIDCLKAIPMAERCFSLLKHAFMFLVNLSSVRCSSFILLSFLYISAFPSGTNPTAMPLDIICL